MGRRQRLGKPPRSISLHQRRHARDGSRNPPRVILAETLGSRLMWGTKLHISVRPPSAHRKARAEIALLFNKREFAQLTGEHSLRLSFRETFSWPRRILAPFHVNWCLLN